MEENWEQVVPVGSVDFPSPAGALDMLERMFSVSFGNRRLPEALPTAPHLFPPRDEYDWARTLKTPLRVKDLRAPKENSNRGRASGCISVLLDATNLGAERAVRHKPNLKLADPAACVQMSKSDPSCSTNCDDSELWYWGPSSEPVLLFQKCCELDEVVTNRNGNTGYFVVNDAHASGCVCEAAIERNNFTFSFYSATCVPRLITCQWGGNPSFLYPFKQDEDTGELYYRKTRLFALNQSMLFADRVSRAATVSPRLTLRQPLARLARDAPKFYRPKAADWDLRTDVDLLCLVHAQLRRPEFTQMHYYFQEDNGPTEYEELEDGKTFKIFPR